MPMPLPGGLPPSASPASPNLGPATPQQGNQGNMAGAMIEIQNAVKMLEKALPMIPMGAPVHEKILNFCKEIGKTLSEGSGGGNHALELQSLIQMARQSAQQAPVAALARAFPSGAGAGGAPALPGASPQPQAA